MNKLADLDKLISEVLGAGLVEEKSVSTQPGKVTTLKLPKFVITERWGEPGSEDRKIIADFTSKIPGSTIAEKFAAINSFVTNCEKECRKGRSVSKALSNLVILDSLSSLITDFNAQTAGFLMEAFLAGLLSGDAGYGPSRQYSLANPEKASKIGTADIKNKQGEFVSVKFLASGTAITGSADDMDKFISAQGDNPKPLKYVLIQKDQTKGSKEVMGLKIYEFYLGSKATATTKGYDKQVFYDKYLVSASKGRRKFEIPQANALKVAGGDVAKLEHISKKMLKSIADDYAATLSQRILIIFDELDKLNKAINEYLIGGHKNKGMEAKAHADTLAVKVAEQTK